ncbi:MAG: DNA polymerase III subunit beta [Candidatus Kuenenia sp.]|uniref:Beta sliding clamp n=1 Tax=Kuenenia stuttgartiensis TaxID=174633 RepID=Q1PVD8_KUEST|nr:DNA polymerase III subunit beta [Candidatus Kuenenia sp.]MCZ7621695.1 DNA polymerase III subunit beta [Candidatus Kuenenia sp.]CAJ71186.1 similar to DNA polymerase III beta subunit [Candidatus Kuenenia stuttgartiensis]
MKILFSGDALHKGFSLTASVVPSSAMKQILQGVKLEVADNCAELTATDLEVLVKYRIPAKACEGEGGIVLPASRANNIFREWAGNEEISVTVEAGHCTLQSKGGSFKILGDDCLQFPNITKTDVTSFVEIDGEILGKMVEKVAYAVSSIKALSIYSGISVKIFGDTIIMVGSDMNRLAVVKRKVRNPENVSMSGIVGVKCLAFLQRFVSECKGTLMVGMGESQIHFIGEKGEVISQLIEGKYPNYDEVIPKNNDKKIEVNRDELLSIVRMASFVTNDEYRVVEFSLTKNKLSIFSSAANVGEAALEIAAQYDGPDYTNTFNPDYILDFLRASDCETITIELGEIDDAALFKTGHEEINVMMPVEWK